MIHVYAFYVILLLATGFALWRGGRVERNVAVMLIAAAVATTALPYRPGASYYSIDLGLFAIDAMLLIGMVIVALRYGRTWLSWACAIQLLTVAVHLAKLYDPLLVPWMYSAASAKLGYGILLLLVIGTLRSNQPTPAVEN